MEIKELFNEYINGCKKTMFNDIGQSIDGMNDVVINVEHIKRKVGLKGDVPNIAITVNNKIVQLIHEFEKADISLFARLKEIDGRYYIVKSFVGDAILGEMLDDLIEGKNQIQKCLEESEEINDKVAKQLDMIKKLGSFKRMLIKIREYIVPNDDLEEVIKRKYREKINDSLDDYRKTNKRTEKYNLKDNLVKSLIVEIKEQKYSKQEIEVILEEDIIPTLEKLGLSELIPNLEENIEKELQLQSYRQWELSKEQKLEQQKAHKRILERLLKGKDKEEREDNVK